jgi:hypothetical protein
LQLWYRWLQRSALALQLVQVAPPVVAVLGVRSVRADRKNHADSLGKRLALNTAVIDTIASLRTLLRIITLVLAATLPLVLQVGVSIAF